MNLYTENQLLNLIIIKIGNEKYALKIENVYRIINIDQIKKIPNTPEYIFGIIKLDEYIIPVIDLYAKYNIGNFNHTKNNSIVILQLNLDKEENIFIGVLTNEVLDIIEIENEKLLPVPVIEKEINKNGLFEGAIEDNSDIILIITPEGIFNQNEINTINQILLKQKKL